MATEPSQQELEKAAADETARELGSVGSRLAKALDRCISKKWLALLLGASILGHGLGLAAYTLCMRRTPKENPIREITVGPFHFIPEQAEGSPLLGADFSLHVVLLEDIEPLARALVAQHKYRIQEAVEASLRKTHGGDFRDPSLADLRRQLQQQVNQAIGMRVISEVVITDLELQWPDPVIEGPTETASWIDREEPAS